MMTWNNGNDLQWDTKPIFVINRDAFHHLMGTTQSSSSSFAVDVSPFPMMVLRICSLIAYHYLIWFWIWVLPLLFITILASFQNLFSIYLSPTMQTNEISIWFVSFANSHYMPVYQRHLYDSRLPANNTIIFIMTGLCAVGKNSFQIQFKDIEKKSSTHQIFEWISCEHLRFGIPNSWIFISRRHFSFPPSFFFGCLIRRWITPIYRQSSKFRIVLPSPDIFNVFSIKLQTR